MTKILEAAQTGAVLKLTLNDDATRNSLSEGMLEALHGAIHKASLDHSINIIIFASSSNAFSSGHNLKELSSHQTDADGGQSYFKRILDQCSELMLAIAQHRCVTIAEVNGLASAAGCQLVASCDFVYASEHAKFCTPGVNIGLFCSTPMVALSRAIGPRHAREMLLTGKTYDAQYALRIGLINEIFEADHLSANVEERAIQIAAKSQTAIGFGKPIFDKQLNLDLASAYHLCSKIMVDNLQDVSAREGIAAVLEKRKPIWPET